jgi:hypothetical protein
MFNGAQFASELTCEYENLALDAVEALVALEVDCPQAEFDAAIMEVDRFETLEEFWGELNVRIKLANTRG